MGFGEWAVPYENSLEAATPRKFHHDLMQNLLLYLPMHQQFYSIHWVTKLSK